MSDALVDLKALREDLAFGERLDRSTPSGDAVRSADLGVGRFDLPSGIFSNPRRTGIITSLIVLILIAGALGGYYYYSRRPGPVTLNGKKTLAVLPFVNSSQDPDVEYLSDGITENVINNLSQISGLKVMPRNSSFKFKDDQNDISAIASKLRVENIITGDIKQLSGKLVVNVHLIDATDDSQIWGKQYIRSSADIFAVQSEIASEVAQTLRVRLTDTDTRRLNKRYTDNVEAYQLFLKGQYSWNKHTRDDVLKSIEFYNQALEKDPHYAGIFWLVGRYGVLGNNFMPPREAFPKAKAYAAKAIEIDETLAASSRRDGRGEPLLRLGLGGRQEGIEAREELDPDSPQLCLLEGDRLEITGRFDEAKAQRKRTLEIDPLLPQFNYVDGATSYFAGEYDDAVTQLEKTVELEPRYYQTYVFLGQAYEQKAMYAKAIETYQRGMTIGHGPDLVAALGHAYAAPRRSRKSRKRVGRTSKNVPRNVRQSLLVCGAVCRFER